jgi:hypothetical protein
MPAREIRRVLTEVPYSLSSRSKGGYYLTLECGHTVFRRAWRPARRPRRVACEQCGLWESAKKR